MAAAERTPSVVVSHLDVVYRVYGSRSRTGEPATLRERLLRRDRAPRTVHAVKDVSLVAYHGESIGVIGRNGSGKSTLLRAVAGLIPPNSGQVWADGSPALLGVNAVLEKGLSGARNVYIGAQALGLTRAQVDAAFDDIVEFSELGDAIHLPMSTYSSGMAARLRFAISTAASPGVLIIDEALATGDAHFRARSEERIAALRSQASTVLIVSHSAGTIRQLCDRAVWLDGGVLVADGPVDEVVDAYERAGRAGTPTEPAEPDVPGVERWYGRDRYTAAALTSRHAFPDGADRVVLASGQDLAVAFAAVPEAGRRAAPVLLVRPRTLPPAVLAELRRLDPSEVVLVADEESVLPAVPDALTAAGFAVTRVSGAGAVGAVAAFVEDEGRPRSPAYLVPHDDDAAALTAALWAGRDGGVVLVTEGASADPALVAAVRAVEPVSLTVLGDAMAVPEAVVDALRPHCGAVERALTPTPADASVEVSAETSGPGVDVVYVTAAVGDAVTGCAAAAAADRPLLLVDRDEVPHVVHDELRRLRPAHVVVLGGPGSVTPSLRQRLADYVRSDEVPEAETLESMA